MRKAHLLGASKRHLDAHGPVRSVVCAPGAALYSAIDYAHDPESIAAARCVPKKRHNLRPNQALKAKYNSGPRSLSCARRARPVVWRRGRARGSRHRLRPAPTRRGTFRPGHALGHAAAARTSVGAAFRAEQGAVQHSRQKCASEDVVGQECDRLRNELAAHAQQCGRAASLGSLSFSNGQRYLHWAYLPSRRHARAPAKPAWLNCATGHRRHCLGCSLAAGKHFTSTTVAGVERQAANTPKAESACPDASRQLSAQEETLRKQRMGDKGLLGMGDPPPADAAHRRASAEQLERGNYGEPRLSARGIHRGHGAMELSPFLSLLPRPLLALQSLRSMSSLCRLMLFATIIASATPCAEASAPAAGARAGLPAEGGRSGGYA